MDWSFPPALQAKYERVLEQTRLLQKEFGITPMTIEQRYEDLCKRRIEKEQQLKELEKLQKLRSLQKQPLPFKK